MRWVVRWRNLDGEQRKEHCDRLTGPEGANAVRLKVEEQLARRTYVDPKAGAVLLSVWVLTVWLPGLGVDPASYDTFERHLRVHILPALGHLAVNKILPSDVKRLRASIPGARTYRDSIMSTLATVMQATVADRLREDNPCHADGVPRPRAAETRPVDVWPEERLVGVLDALPNHLWAWGATGAGCGHRPGELVAISPEDFDPAAGEVQVVRQLKWMSKGRGWVFAPPKFEKERTTILADSVWQAVGAHMERWPPVKVELPWFDKREARSKHFRPMKVPLVFVNKNGTFINLKRVNEWEWKRALVDAGVIPAPEKERRGEYEAAPDDAPGALRHFFASSQLAAGESVHDVAAWMGHTDPMVTIRRYIRRRTLAGDHGRSATDRLLSGRVTPAR
ncbi:tyrosine-type recombinase/integrase [Streptomyces sp. NPDC056401]|uniref:tyrosine-type recombinase/integrase n=1 Tax=Streptomyces sp. NPDC056401 TaxID=3345809 RepID=UPI0035DCCC60